MALFEQAIKMWAPFTPGIPGVAGAKTEAKPAADEPDSLDDMKRQLEAMQKQLDLIANGKK
jgi:polyhydroxyalkanoate synthesis regulator protein